MDFCFAFEIQTCLLFVIGPCVNTTPMTKNIGDFVPFSLQECGVFPSPHSINLLVDPVLEKIIGLALIQLSQNGMGLKRESDQGEFS